jgi:RimJ/RimL family protein N-acetyltransferase
MLADSLFHGELIRLTAIRSEDTYTFSRWYEDSTFGRLFDGATAFPHGSNRARQMLEEGNRATSFTFAMRTHYNDDMIGVIFLDDIRWNNRNGWIGLAIGEAANRGKGYGREAMRLVMRYAFHELNLHRLQLTVFSYNLHAIHLYDSLGFVREGTHREAILRDGAAHDMHHYGILAREWDALHNKP